METALVGRPTHSRMYSRLSRATAERIRAEGDLVNSRAAYQNVVDTLKKLIDPQTPKNPNANP